MLSFFRKRRNKKAARKRDSVRKITGKYTVSSAHDGYNPYDTLPGRPREEFGMRRKEDDKWSF